jgi:hypothetical protein
MLTLFGKYEAVLFLMHSSTLYLSLCFQVNHRLDFLIQSFLNSALPLVTLRILDIKSMDPLLQCQFVTQNRASIKFRGQQLAFLISLSSLFVSHPCGYVEQFLAIVPLLQLTLVDECCGFQFGDASSELAVLVLDRECSLRLSSSS